MPILLQIDSSPRGRSRSRQLTRLFAELWTRKFPDTEIIHRDLAVFAPPHVGEPWIAAAFTSPDQRTRPMSQALQISDLLVDELLRADAIVIGTPMYNFGLPSVLKAYFDNVIRVNRTFLFEPDDSENPYKPLVEDKPAYVVVATGDAGYRSDGPLWQLNHLEPHLRTMLNFIGISQLQFVYTENDEFGGERLARSQSSAERTVRMWVETAEAECALSRG